ncbi:YppE family protein [Bacillus suaedaesalsae]|uniref:YppE family protein n=1 Tax=Bacillus suaedaesalsae TaxID=2810349 RepID=A0ABS2DMV9_9BACI|nr:YppE family protein [Bacillus suaedaesalsae]MBM6619817.1 YppE family protein [Bacillus suaedaesalsae]
MNKELIRNDTVRLLQYNKELMEIFANTLKEDVPSDFHSVVKPYADQVFELTNRWNEQVNIWIKKERPKYLHPNQIENTIENITTVALQAFYPDTRPKRFKELIRSNEYILESIIQKLND